jgi:hypothetical protein
VKSKQAADTIIAKGLSFGGRRHETERFWELGQGGMCMRCCGRDHFGKCTEEAKCFVCAGNHEGREHECTVESCSKRSNHANIMRRSARTAKDRTKRHRKNALRGELADILG